VSHGILGDHTLVSDQPRPLDGTFQSDERTKAFEGRCLELFVRLIEDLLIELTSKMNAQQSRVMTSPTRILSVGVGTSCDVQSLNVRDHETAPLQRECDLILTDQDVAHGRGCIGHAVQALGKLTVETSEELGGTIGWAGQNDAVVALL